MLLSCICLRSPISTHQPLCTFQKWVFCTLRKHSAHPLAGPCCSSWHSVLQLLFSLGLSTQVPISTGSSLSSPSLSALVVLPRVAVNYSQLPSLLLGLAKVSFIPAKCLIFRKLLDGCRWIFIPHELCPFWTTTKPTHVETLGCEMPTKNLGGVLKL